MKADPAKTHELQKWKHNRPFISCRFDPEGRFLFAGAQDNDVQRIEIASGKRAALAAHDSWVRAIAFSPDGKTTYTGGFDGRLVWWVTEAESPKPIRKVEAHAGWLRAVAVSRDGKLLATCGNDHVVKLWNAADGSLVREFKGHARHVYNVVFHPAGDRLVSFDLMGVIREWSAADGKQLREIKAPDLHKYDTTFRADIGGARSMAFSEDGKLFAAGGITKVTNAFAGIGNPAVVVFDWIKGEKVQLHQPKANLRGVAWGIAFHSAGFLICTAGGGSGGFLYFYKHDKPNEFHQVKLPNQGRDLSLHQDGILLAIPHYDGNLRLYAMREKAKQPPKK